MNASDRSSWWDRHVVAPPSADCEPLSPATGTTDKPARSWRERLIGPLMIVGFALAFLNVIVLFALLVYGLVYGYVQAIR